MNFSEARKLVKTHPKFIGDYRRQQFTKLRETKAVNWMIYENKSAACRLAASIGDGYLYKLELIGSGSSPKVATPGETRL